jgi:SAM-dependent methyltransferase
MATTQIVGETEIVSQEIFTNYQEIYYQHDQYGSDKWEQYFSAYDKAFKEFVGKNPDVLEIGVQNGGGLQIASKYFINGNIYGIDINKKVCNLPFESNIKAYCFDAKDKTQFETYFKDKTFDTILDDGSHINSDITITFRNLFPKLKPGGVYMMEDLHTSYWPGYEGGYLKKESAIELLKHFVDLLHAYHIRESSFFEQLSPEDKYIVAWVDHIVFYDSVAYIKKLTQPRSKNYQRTFTGKYCNIAKISTNCE